MVFQDSTNLNNISKYIVDANGDTPYTTVQAALDAANTAGGGIVYIRPGTYTENLTCYDNTEIVGAVGEVDAGNIIIDGIHVPPAAGAFAARNIQFDSATNIFNSAVAGTAEISINECILNATNGYTLNLVNWTGTFRFNNCNAIGTNDGFINNTGAATIFTNNSQLGAGAGNTFIANGTLRFDLTYLVCPATLTGAGANIGLLWLCQRAVSLGGTATWTIDNGSKFFNTLTTADTATVSIANTTFETGANTAITHGSANELSLADVTIDTSNVVTIGGAGAGNLLLGSVTYLDTSAVAGTLTPVFTTRLETGSLKIADADQGAFAINAGVCTSIQGQNILYVGKHGNDANDGLVWENALLTVQAAVTAATAGTTILVDPGIYTETVTHAADDVIVFARGDHGNCIIRQADANVIDFNTRTGILYKFFTVECTAATTAINTITGSTGTCIFKDCDLRMVTAANLAQVAQPGIGELTGAGIIEIQLGEMDYLHTGNGGGTAQKAAFTVANGGLITLHGVEDITINNSGTALASALAIDLATTGNIRVHYCTIDITDPNATVVVGLAYLGGTGITHEFYRNSVHVTATANTGYGFFAADTLTTSRFFYNHIHVVDTGGTSYTYHIGNTATVISHFDDLISDDGVQLVGGGTFTQVSSQDNGDLSVTNLTQYAPVIGGGATAMTPLGPLTNGQLVVGSTGAAPVAVALASGDGSVTITNGAGTIVLAAAAGLTWSVEAGAAVAAAVNSGYISNRAGGVTYTIPTTAAVGSIIRICSIQGLSTIAQNAAESIVFGAFTTTVGAGGSLVATNVGDAIEIVCTVADTTWAVLSSIGNWTVN